MFFLFLSNSHFFSLLNLILAFFVYMFVRSVWIASANLLTRDKTAYFSISSIFIGKLFHTHKRVVCKWKRQNRSHFEWWMAGKWQICEQIYPKIHLFDACAIFLFFIRKHSLSLFLSLTSTISLVAGFMDSPKRLSFINCQSNNVQFWWAIQCVPCETFRSEYKQQLVRCVLINDILSLTQFGRRWHNRKHKLWFARVESSRGHDHFAWK